MRLFRHQYYLLKPYLPWRLRMAVRRWTAKRKLAKCRDIWPIKPGTETPPQNWPGWPDGKKFAVVLTHDVEGPQGLARVKQLAELEMKLGFRSSFNFIPEGDYRVPKDLRDWLTGNGFEVGVHDLYHDGKLYTSREAFRRHAQKINHYLKEWDAVGFRSGFMHHNLDWLHDLNIEYDASTFDTDPFEPQPDGAHTIFPFWVPSPSPTPTPTHTHNPNPTLNLNLNQKTELRDQKSAPTSDLRSQTSSAQTSALSPQSSAAPRRGYIELPYTLPQDSTVFTLFERDSIEIWKTKLDWIAEHGGMAMVNVHPDFLSLDRRNGTEREISCAHYESLLNYIRTRYDGGYWNALPREVARFAGSVKPRNRHHGQKRICMITHSYYETDGRVMRYAEALADRGDEVDVLALRRSPGQPKQETTNGVRVWRLQERSKKTEQRQIAYLFPLLKFLFASSAVLCKNHLRKRYDAVHVHNIPDFLVFAAWLPKLTGAAVILDVHDLVPEFYANKFGTGQSSLPVKALRWIERASASFADHVIISNHLWLDNLTSRSAPQSKCSVFINHVDEKIFHARPRKRHDGKFIVLFPGGLQWHQGLDIAIRAFSQAQKSIPRAEFHIYGDGNQKDNLVTLARSLGLNGTMQFFDPLPTRQIADVMANADMGVVPKRADSFGNEAYSTKIMEFMALGVPVVASSTKIDRYYFDDSVLRFFESGNPDALAAAMLDVIRDNDQRQRMIKNASDYAVRNSWDTKKQEYLALVDSLISPNK